MTRSKDRMAFFLPGLYEGGAERVILNLAGAVAERGYRVDLVLARAEGPYLLQVPASVRLVDLKARRVLSSVPSLVRYLRDEQPVALLSALFTNLIALVGQRLSGFPRRIVISEHNTLSAMRQNQADLRWQMYPKLAGWLYSRADEIVAVSSSVADDLARITTIPRDRIKVVCNPVVTPDLQRKSEEILDHPWFRADEPPVIVSVGRLTSQKAFDVLIRAFSRVRKNYPVRLLILGEGEERPRLECLIRQLDLEQDVRLPGFVQNPYPYMSHAALFVLSSRWEGSPTVLVEALYCGVPVVATDCPGGSREILKDGKYGRLVPVDCPQLLAEALQAALARPELHPPRESWAPYRLELAVDRYLRLLLGV